MPETVTQQPPSLISEEYRRMQEKMHENPEYGKASLGFVELVADVIEKTGVTEMLDYGAGKGRLAMALEGHLKRPLQVYHYDPAIPKWAAPPQPRQLVVCIDVLEHIEPSLIDNVLDDLRRVTVGVGVFTIHTGAALKVLPDGRNAHLIQQPPDWWLPRLLRRFELVHYGRMDVGFWVIVEPKPA